MSLKRICGVDLGSDTIKICDKNQKKLLCEKNMIAVRNRTDLIGVGQDAFEIYEKAPSDVYAGCPIQNGSLAEGSSQETILIHLMKIFLHSLLITPIFTLQLPQISQRWSVGPITKSFPAGSEPKA